MRLSERFRAVAELDRVLLAMAGGKADVTIVVPPEPHVSEDEFEAGDVDVLTADHHDYFARQHLEALRAGTPDWMAIAEFMMPRWAANPGRIRNLRWLLDRVPRIDAPRELWPWNSHIAIDFVDRFRDLCELTRRHFRHIEEVRKAEQSGHAFGPKYEKRLQRMREDPPKIAMLRHMLEQDADLWKPTPD